MRDLLGMLAWGVLAGMAGGAAVLAVNTWARRMARRRGFPFWRAREERQGGERSELGLVRGDIIQLKSIAERVHQDVTDLSGMLKPLLAPGGLHDDEQAPSASVEPSRRELAGWGSSPPSGAPAGFPRDPASPRREPEGREGAGSTEQAGVDRDLSRRPGDRDRWRTDAERGSTAPVEPYRPPRPPRDPWELPPREPWLADIDAGATEPAAGSAFEAAASPAEPAAPRAPAAPPPNAVNVEARDDRIVASTSYPPEAWLEPRGPAVAHLWLNPHVALNENALRRLSTFFQWQGERAGATYDTESPAILRWDEGQRVGTITQRGTARPR